MPVEEPHQTIKKAFELEDGIEKRRKMLISNLHYLMKLMGCHHPNGGFELSFIKRFDYKTFLKEWEAFFDVMHKEHIKAKWYNPFLSRSVYNFIRLLPVKLISQCVYNALRDATNVEMTKLEYTKDVEDIFDIDILSCPLVFFDHQRELVDKLYQHRPPERLLMIREAVHAGQELVVKLREAEDRLVMEYHNLLVRYGDLQKEHINHDAKEASLLNLRYAIMTFAALFKIPYAITGYSDVYLHPTVLAQEDLLNIKDFMGAPLSTFEQQLHTLSTSTNPLLLITTMRAFLSHPSDMYNAFVTTRGFSVLAERFGYYTKLTIQDVLKSLTFKPHPELVQAVRVDQAGLRATIKRLTETHGVAGYDINGDPIDKDGHHLPDTLSLPRRYWIRTLDGEFYVDDAVTKVGEEDKHVYNFIRTAVGNEAEAVLEETLSIFGKTLKEEERRYVDQHAGDRGDIGTINRDNLQDLTDKVRRERDERGTSHLGYAQDGKNFEAIQAEAKRWAARVIAQWKHEVDGLRTKAYDDEERKKTTAQEAHPKASEGAAGTVGNTG